MTHSVATEQDESSATVSWLLEKSNPSVRYFTLMDIPGRKVNASDVREARAAIPESRAVSAILARMAPQGHWEDPENPYLPKYRSSYWQVMVLGLLGCHRSDARVRRACEFIFGFQHDEGGFSAHTQKLAMREYEYLRGKGRRLPPPAVYAAESIREQQLSCLTGNVVAALIRMGYLNDRRTKKAIEWLVDIQNDDGGWLCPYWKAHARDKHGCFHGTICALDGLCELEPRRRTKGMSRAIDRGAEFLLIHRLFRADHHCFKVVNDRWLDLSFPWFSEYTVLRGLDVLTRTAHVGDERLSDATALILEKRLSSGAWILERTPAGRMQTNLEPKGRPSKWVTLIALRSLMRLPSAGAGRP